VIKSFQQRSQLNEESNLLTPKEKEVLELLSKGLLYKEIAERLGVTHETVKKHLKNIYQKLHVQNKIEALNKFRLL
jgi:RNA polymerase sigma factor (sigma-70 family)